MPKRKREPDEALGPSLDGLDQIERLELALRPEESEEAPEEEPEQTHEPEEPQTALICGTGERALACARLAAACGFIVKYAADSQAGADRELENLAAETILLDGYDGLIEKCGVDSSCYICIFLEDPDDCESLIFQSLDSDAAYVGAWAGPQLRREIFAKLKEAGAPDAELAAVCCPMGLGIGSETPEQDAVAVLAEMLAARSGVLKRLRYRA